MKEYIVVLDKRNGNVLDFNGHSVDPIEYEAVFMRFNTEHEASKSLIEECECEELNPDNYEVAIIRILKERIK